MVQQVSSSVSVEGHGFESHPGNLSDFNLVPQIKEKNATEKPSGPPPGTEIHPPNIPRSPTWDVSQNRRRFPNPRSKSASPVVTETPEPYTRIKTESKSELTECSVAEGLGRDRRPYSPLRPEPAGVTWDPTLPPSDPPNPFRPAHGCHVCGKSFATAYGLAAHFVCHTGERPYTCTRCKFRFSRPADLKKHERIHTGERPYPCSLCGRRFNRTENLRRHLKKVHHGTMV